MCKETWNDILWEKIDTEIEKKSIEGIDNNILEKYIEMFFNDIIKFIEEWKNDPIISSIEKIKWLFWSVDPRFDSTKLFKIADLDNKTVEWLLKTLNINPAYSVIFVDEKNNSINSKIWSIDWFSKLFKYPNIRVISLSENILLTKIISIYNNTWRYGFTKDLSSILNIIEHSLPWELRRKNIKDFTDEEISSQKDIINKGRELWINWLDKEVLKSIKETKTEDIEENQFLECPNTIFCDWEDTLFINNEFKSELLEKALKKCIELNKNLVIWTWWDLKVINSIGKYVKGINISICSKNDCKWLKVFWIIDDLPKEEIENRYWVKIDNYINL